jgi:hypothetical protein
MVQEILNLIGIGLLSAVLAIATIIGNAMRIDKDPAIDGPRTLTAEFFSLWIAFAFLAWSFVVDGPTRLQWILRGVSAGAAIIGLSLAAYFAGTPEVRIRLDEEPTGFAKPITALHLDEADVKLSDAPRSDRTWSEFHPSN